MPKCDRMCVSHSVLWPVVGSLPGAVYRVVNCETNDPVVSRLPRLFLVQGLLPCNFLNGVHPGHGIRLLSNRNAPHTLGIWDLIEIFFHSQITDL